MSASVSARNKCEMMLLRVVGQRLAQVHLRIACCCRQTAPAPCNTSVRARDRRSRPGTPDRASGSSSSASLIGPRYLIPCRMPNDSASAPMLAASQKWPSGRCGVERNRRSGRGDAGLERGLAFGLGQAVGPKPVTRLRQFVGRFKILRVRGQPRRPNVGRLLRARQVLAVLVERVRIVGGNLQRDSCIQCGYGTRTVHSMHLMHPRHTMHDAGSD